MAVCVARHSQPAAPRYQVEKCRAHTSDPQFCRFYQLLLWLRDMTHFVLWQDGSLVILFILPFRLLHYHLKFWIMWWILKKPNGNNVVHCTLYNTSPRGQDEYFIRRVLISGRFKLIDARYNIASWNNLQTIKIIFVKYLWCCKHLVFVAQQHRIQKQKQK